MRPYLPPGLRHPDVTEAYEQQQVDMLPHGWIYAGLGGGHLKTPEGHSSMEKESVIWTYINKYRSPASWETSPRNPQTNLACELAAYAFKEGSPMALYYGLRPAFENKPLPPVTGVTADFEVI